MSVPIRKRIIGVRLTGILLLILINSAQVSAQLIYQPYSYQFYQKLNKSFYDPATNLHTSLKPYLITDSSVVRPAYDSLMNLGQGKIYKSWLGQVLFNRHLIDIRNKEYTFYMDFLPDVQLGREFNEKKTTHLNTRGYQVFGTIGSNFFFYSSGYENQGKFANYQNAYIIKTGMVPGQAYNKGSTAIDWSLVTALIAYKLNHRVTFELGEDKTFIGDGYRSVLLSDYAAAYPLFRVTADLGKHIQYMAMWAYLGDQKAVQFNSFYNNRRKWAAFHYIDWNINNRASLGFFNALIAAEADDQGKSRGFDFNYINPLFFASSLGPSGAIPAHTLFGFNGKYKVLNKTIVYGQFLYDQAPSTLDNKGKKAWQLGARGSDLFKVDKLNYLFEFNTAAPNTYAGQFPIVDYAELNEPLAHPFRANFREWLGIFNYSIGKFDLQAQLVHAQYGLPITKLNYAEGTVGYLLNPKYNLRIETGALFRQEKNSLSDTKTTMITIGLRSSFRNLYHDF